MKMMTPFRYKKSEILRERGTAQSHSGIEDGLVLTQHSRVFTIRPPAVLDPEQLIMNNSSTEPLLLDC